VNRLEAMRLIARNKFAWPGGYEIFAITADGETVCHECIRKEYRSIYRATRDKGTDAQWEVAGHALDCETESQTFCAHCNRIIVEDRRES
jgi:hypothetical protein